MAQISAMDLPANGLHVVQGELCILLNSMRRPFKWSSQLYLEEEQDALLKNLNQLKEKLYQVSSLNELELLTVLSPFLEVIRSEDTSGPVTEMALSSIFKFLSYGLIDPSKESTAVVVETIADAVTHARFVGTDAGSDEVVLMRILQVLRKLVLHPAGILLSNESICEIMQSCFRICFETRLSELLRKSAEHALSEMVRLLYARLPQFPLQETKGSINYKKLKMRTAAYDPSRNKKKPRSSPKPRPKTLAVNSSHSKANSTSEASPCVETPTAREPPLESPASVPTVVTPQVESTGSEISTEQTSLPHLPTVVEQSTAQETSLEMVDGNSASGQPATIPSGPTDEASGEGDPTGKDYINAQGVRFTIAAESSDEISPGKIHVPYGLPSVRELLRFLISLINPLERQNSEAMIHIGLKLLTVAFETAADAIASVPSLLPLIQDETCRHLFALLGSERVSVLAAACRLCFLLFESARHRLKFQLETYVLKLTEIVAHESPKVAYERRLIALEAISQLCRIPGLLTELYLNYDCDCHTSDLFEELIKHLSKNVAPVAGGIYAIHLLSLETLLVLVDSIEAHCRNSQVIGGNEVKGEVDSIHLPPAARNSRLDATTADVPSNENLAAIRQKKKLLIAGAEQFNTKPAKGIQFLQENGLLSDPLEPSQVATLLRECSRLDKKQIGEYVSNRKNLEVLEAFVRSFDFRSIRIDEALRLYLEAFRLPGEAPLIALLMEQFAAHWHSSNDAPFHNADAAFTLAYAVIMLNVDQHNHNVKRQNIPMTIDEFKRNLSKVNGGQDFEAAMLEEIYQSIKNEEIVMPAEQTGLVKENYLWKMLLRRGATKDGIYLQSPNGLFDRDLFLLAWAPTVSALGCLLDKAPSEGSGLTEWVLQALRKVSAVAAHYGRSDVFDHIVQMLVKFSGLLPGNDNPALQAVGFGQNRKAQLATSTLFQLVHRHGDILREGWKLVVDCIIQLYRMRVLPDDLVETEDLFDPTNKIKLVSEEAPSARSETSGLFSSLYSYIALSEGSASGRSLSAEDQEALRRAKDCVLECNIDQLIADSKFLQTRALQDFVRVLIASNDMATSNTSEEYAIIFILELITRITVQNRDRVTCIWNPVRDHIYSLVMGAAAADQSFILERSIVGLLLLTGRLMRREDVAPIVLQSLRMLLLLKPPVLSRVSRQVSFGLHELLKTGAANVHTTGDWRVLFTLLECVGAGASPPSVRGGDLAHSTSMDCVHSDLEGGGERPLSPNRPVEAESSLDRGYTSDSELYENSSRSAIARSSWTASPGASGVHGSSPELNAPAQGPAGGGGWIFVGRQGEIEHLKGKQVPGREYNIVHDRKLFAHDPLAFVKSCESLSFLVRDVAHITPENFECAVQCIRTFVEASLNGGGNERSHHHSQSQTRGQRPREEHLRRSKSASFHGNAGHDHYSASGDHSDHELPSNYHQVPIQLLDLMHTLHTRAAQIYQWWASEGADADQTAQTANLDHASLSLWSRGWCPLLQGIARLCCDSRKQVRTTAITYLQRSLLVHDLQSLSASEWESCFNTVLFPLLGKLLDPVQHGQESQRPPQKLTRAQLASDHAHWEETRIRAATLLSKVFLQHLGPLLHLPTFTALWLTLLDFMDKYMHVEHNDLLAEAVPEMMKNLLLVMETAGAFGSPSEAESPDTPPHAIQMKEQLWHLTCDRIDVFLPGLRQEVIRSKTPIARIPSVASTISAATSTTTTSGAPETETTNTEGSDVQIDEVVVAVDVPPAPEPSVPEQSASVEEGTGDGDLVQPEDTKLNFIPPTVFSLFNVPDPSDAAAFFFHNVEPAVSNDQTGQDQQEVSILPISLLPPVDGDLAASAGVPLPILVPAQSSHDDEEKSGSDGHHPIPLVLSTEIICPSAEAQ